MRPFKLRGYVIERLLGSGASGDVWRARAAASGAPVALKRMVVTSAEQRARAHAEAALLCALDHPNLVRLHAVVATDDAVVLVLDLAEGGSLAELLAARGRLTPGEVITAVAPVAAALSYLHGEGVVHCDVSPANVLFTAAGVPLLADVGVARLLGDDSEVAATPAYVDPTVAAGGVPGAPSDVFMLGGVALHALTGAPPWAGADPGAAVALAAVGDLGDVAATLTGAGASPTMAAVLARALSVDPHRRGTAADLALDLRHSGSPVAVDLQAGGRRAEPQAPPRSGPRHAAPFSPSRPAAAGSQVDGSRAGRPSFARPSELDPTAWPQPPTRMVGPRPRPVISRPPRRRRPSLRLAPVAGALALAGVILAAGLLWVGGANAPSTDAARRIDPPVHVETVSGPGAGSSAPSAGAAATDARTWTARIAALDALRARAFAQRDARLLDQVYVRGPLLAADTALLSRIVPPGCGLAGARTTYSAVRAIPRGKGATITATARLAPSQLVCAGQHRGRAAGAGPTVLRLELVSTADGLRIATQRRL